MSLARAIQSSRVTFHAGAEFLVLFGLWILFTGQVTANELLAGLVAALLAAFAATLVKSRDSAYFRPRVRWLLLALYEPWYVLRGMVLLFAELARALAGRPARVRLYAVRFEDGSASTGSFARRSLAIIYSTISPDSVALGIDRERQLLLLHQMPPGEAPASIRPLEGREAASHSEARP